MKVICTTSDKYHHLLLVFFYLYAKYWNASFDLVGYKKPTCPLPDNCTWVSLGEQGPVSEWSTDLRRYFEKQPDWFVWIMEDTFLREKVGGCPAPGGFNVGKICLTNDVSKREHTLTGDGIVIASPTSRYRLSTQPSIWNKNYLLQYLKPNMTPWEMETQDPMNDGWEVIGLVDYPVKHNEGVTRHDIYKLNLAGMCQEDIDHIKSIAPWMK